MKILVFIAISVICVAIRCLFSSGQRKAIRTVTETMVGEIARTLDFFTATSAESRIGKAYLSGGAARLAGFANAFEERTCLEVEVMNPLARMLPSRGFDPDYLDSVASSLGVGIGLATRKVDVQ